MRPSAKKWFKFILRWSIAVVGITYVVMRTPLHDQVTVLDDQNRPVKVTLASEWDEQDAVRIIDPVTGEHRAVPADILVNTPDRRFVLVEETVGVVRRPLLALRLSPDLRHAERFLIEAPDGTGQWVTPHQVRDYELKVPYPLVDRGLIPMVRGADRNLLLAALFLFPLTYLITSLRWNELLKVVGIRMGVLKAAVVNMVGAFYNTFMPGSTGGDVLKAYYAAKLAPEKRTRAVMSVIVDRAVGMITLIILGGTVSTYLAFNPHIVGETVARHCAQVAAGACILIALIIGGLFVFYVPALRKRSGLGFALARLPMQAQVNKAIEAMELYRQRPWVVLSMLLASVPVHMTVITSVMLAGMALDLPLSWRYYWVVVPVVVLAGSIPISPQGAGVMEFFAIILTRTQGATVGQAFALTMSIRLIHISWNLVGGIFVALGGYHAPTPSERESLERDRDLTEAPAAK